MENVPYWLCCKVVAVNVISVDDTLGEVMTPLTDADQINTSQSDVNKLSAVLNGSGIVTLMTSCQ